MSQIGTGQLDISRRRRNPNIGPERTGITESLSAPGIVAAPPTVSSTANTLAQFDQALGLTGQLASGIDTTIQRERALDARTQRAQDRIDQGAAFVDVSTDLVKDAEQISEFGLDYFTELEQAGQSFEDIADSIFDLRTEGMSDAYKQRYIQTFKPRYVAALQDRREAVVAEARDESISKLYNIVPDAMNKEEIEGVLESVRAVDPDISDMEAKAPLVDIGLELAAKGDEQGVTRVLEVLGDEFRVEQSKINRRLTATQKTVQAQREQDTYNMLDARIKAGTPAEMMREQIEAHRDRFRTDRPAEDLLLRLEARESGEISEQQREYLNATRRDIGLGVYPEGDPDKAARQVIQDMMRPSDDGQHIPASQGLAMLDQLQQGLEFDAYRAAVKSKLSGDSSLPLTSSYDTALDTELASMGVVEAIPTENGQALIRRITNPEGFAYASDKAGRVTSSARQVIAAGLAGDQATATEAAQTYVALHKQNPALAEQVMQNMGGKAKLRARFLQSRLPFNPNPWNEPDFMRLDPIDVDKDTLRQAVWSPDDDDPVRDSRIREMSREQIKEALQDTDHKDTFRFGFGRSVAPISATTAKKYGDMIEEEYTFARSMVDSDEQAMNMAKEWATARFFAESPPMLWDGEVSFTSQGISTPTNLEELVRLDLQDQGWNEDAIDELVEGYRPVWDQSNSAWAFRDESGVLYTAPPTDENIGGPLLLDLLTPEGVRDIQQKRDEWGDWEDQSRREKREQRDPLDAFKDSEGNLIEGIP